MEHKLFLSFYGVGVCIESELPELIDSLRHDFSYFLAESGNNHGAIRILYHFKEPPYNSLPEMTSSLATPRNICYESNKKTYIDYFGKALNVSDIRKNEFHIYTKDNSLAREIAYLTILSRACELLEIQHIHRIHGLGIEYKGSGIIITIPCGGGKTTLALSLLNHQEKPCRLISEDSPLIKNLMLLPFPLRIGTRPDTLAAYPDISQEYIREFRRMEFDTKITIDIRFFANKICKEPVKAKILFVGVRTTSNDCRIKPISKFKVLRHCLMNSVIGIGLYQGIEFVMQKNFAGFLKYSAILFSRILVNLRLLMKVKTFELVLGRDPEKNAATLCGFLQELYG